jgi:chromosome segregation ATPase
LLSLQKIIDTFRRHVPIVHNVIFFFDATFPTNIKKFHINFCLGMPTDILLAKHAVKNYLHEFATVQKQYETAKDDRAKAMARLRMKHISHQMIRSEAGLDGLVDILSRIPTRSKKQEEDLQAYRELRLRLQKLQSERAQMTSLVENLQTALIQERTNHNDTRRKLNQAETELHALQQHIVAASTAFRRIETNIHRYIAAIAKRNPDEAMELQQAVMTHDAHSTQTRHLEQQIAKLRNELQAQGQLATQIAEQSEADIAQLQEDANSAIEGLQKQNATFQSKIIELQNRQHAHMSAPDQMFNTPATHTSDDVSDTVRFVVKACMVVQHSTDAASEWLANNVHVRFGKFVRTIAEDPDSAAAMKRVATSIRRAKLCGQANLICHYGWYVQELMLNACGAINILSRRVCSADTKDCGNDLAIEPLLSTLYHSLDASEELLSFLGDITSELADVGVSDALFVSEASILGQASSALAEFAAAHQAFRNLAVQSFNDEYSEARQFATQRKLGPAVHRALALWSVALTRLRHLGFTATSASTMTENLVDASRELLARQMRQMEAVQKFAQQSATYLSALASCDLINMSQVTGGLQRPWFKAANTPPDLSITISKDNLHLVVLGMLKELADLKPHWMSANMSPGLQLLLASTVLDAFPPLSSKMLQAHRSIIRFEDADLLMAAQTVDDVVSICQQHFRGMHAITPWDGNSYLQHLSNMSSPPSQLWQTSALSLRRGLLDSRQGFTSLGFDPLARDLLRTENGVATYRQQQQQQQDALTDKHKAVLQLLFQPNFAFPRYDAQQMPTDTQETVDQRLLIHLRGAVTQAWQELRKKLDSLQAIMAQQPASKSDEAMGAYATIWLTKGLVKDTMHQDMLHRISTLQHMMAQNTLVYQRQARQAILTTAELRFVMSNNRRQITILQHRLHSDAQQLITLHSEFRDAETELKSKARQYETLRATAKRAKAAIDSLDSMPATQDTAIVQAAMQGSRDADNTYIKFNQMSLRQLEDQWQKAEHDHMSPEQMKHITDQIAAVRATLVELEREQAEDNGRDYESEQVARQALATASHLKNLLASVNADLSKIENEKHDLANREQTARTKVETQKAKIIVLEKELTKSQSALEKERKELHDTINKEVEKVLANLIPADHATLKTLEDKLVVYNNMVKNQRDEYINEELRLQTKTTELENEIARLKRERMDIDEATKGGITGYNAEIKRLDDEIADLNGRYEAAIAESTQLHATITAQQVNLDQQQAQLMQSKLTETAMIAERDAAVQALKKHTDSENFQDAVETQQIEQLNTQITALITQNATLEQQIKATTAAAKAGGTAAATAADVVFLREELDRANAQLQQANETHQRLEESVIKYTRLINELNQLPDNAAIAQFVAENKLPEVPEDDVRTALHNMLERKVEEKKLLAIAGGTTVQAVIEKLKQATDKLAAMEAKRTAERTKFEMDIQTLEAARSDTEKAAAKNMEAVRLSITEYDKLGKRASDLLAQARTIVQEARTELLTRFQSGQGVQSHDKQKEKLKDIANEYEQICEQLSQQHQQVFEAALEQSKQELTLAGQAFLAVVTDSANSTVEFNGEQMSAKTFMQVHVIDFLTQLAPGSAATTMEAWNENTSQHNWEVKPQSVLHDLVVNKVQTSHGTQTDKPWNVRERLFSAARTIIALRVAHVSHKADLLLAVKDMYLDMFETLNTLDLYNMQIVEAANHEAKKLLHDYRVGDIDELSTLLETLKEQLHQALSKFSSQDDFHKMFLIANQLGIMSDDNMPAAQQTWGEWFKNIPSSMKHGIATVATTGAALALGTGMLTMPSDQMEQYNAYLEPLLIGGIMASATAVTHGANHALQNFKGPQLDQNKLAIALVDHAKPLEQVDIAAAKLVAETASSYVQTAFGIYVRMLQLRSALTVLANLQTYQASPDKIVANVLRKSIQKYAAQAVGVLNAQSSNTDAQVAELQSQIQIAKQRIEQLEEELRKRPEDTDIQKKISDITLKLNDKMQNVVAKVGEGNNSKFNAKFAAEEEKHLQAVETAQKNHEETRQFLERTQSATGLEKEELERQFAVHLAEQNRLNEEALQASRDAYAVEEEKFKAVLEHLTQKLTKSNLECQEQKKRSDLYEELVKMIPYTLSDLEQQLAEAKAKHEQLQREKQGYQDLLDEYSDQKTQNWFASFRYNWNDTYENTEKQMFIVNEKIASAEAEISRLANQIDIVGQHLPTSLSPITVRYRINNDYHQKLVELQKNFHNATAQTIDAKVTKLEKFRSQVQMEIEKQAQAMSSYLDASTLQSYQAELKAHADDVYIKEAQKMLADIKVAYNKELAAMEQQKAALPPFAEKTVVNGGNNTLETITARNQELQRELEDMTEQLHAHKQQQPKAADSMLEGMLTAKNQTEAELTALRANMQTVQQESEEKIALVKTVSENALKTQEANCKQQMGVLDPAARAYYTTVLGTTKFDQMYNLGGEDGTQSIFWLLGQTIFNQKSKYYFGRKQAIDANLLEIWVYLYRHAVEKPVVNNQVCSEHKTITECLVHGKKCIYNNQQCQSYTTVDESVRNSVNVFDKKAGTLL